MLFKASQDPGYACFRIPAIVKTNDGTLLAFAEGRALNCGDAADIDIVLKRSTDGGRTWGPLQVVTDGGGDTHGNPAPVVDRTTGRVLLAETYNTGRTDSGNCAIPCDRTPHLQYSDDDGLTWSKPRDLSREILPAHWNSWYATGPVHGIQLTRGRHPGRLVIGVNSESWNGSRVTANHAALVVSDDGGDHWRVGATDSWPVAEDGTFRQKPSELTGPRHGRHRDWSGYSDLVRIDDTTVGLMYEGGTADARDEIRFARFTEDWLQPRRGPDPTTADLAPLTGGRARGRPAGDRCRRRRAGLRRRRRRRTPAVPAPTPAGRRGLHRVPAVPLHGHDR
ncbi:hypothetical protein GCM10027074_74690 [Streptomyces deserti]